MYALNYVWIIPNEENGGKRTRDDVYPFSAENDIDATRKANDHLNIMNRDYKDRGIRFVTRSLQEIRYVFINEVTE